MEIFKLAEGQEYIELFKLLKYFQIAESGAQAKIFIEEGQVQVNDEVCTLKRKKIKVNDVVKVFEEHLITVE